MACFPSHFLFDAPIQGNPLEFVMKLIVKKIRKLKGWGYCTVAYLNFNRFWLIHPCDGQTFRRTGDSIYRYALSIPVCCRVLKRFVLKFSI